MRTRRFYLLLIGVLALIGVLVAVVSGPREPEYKGKKLSEWVIEYRRYAWASAPSFDQTRFDEAKDAISHIGTNALPSLVKWIQYEPPPWKIKLNALLGKRFSWWRDERYARALAARDAFLVLRHEARRAVPEL